MTENQRNSDVGGWISVKDRLPEVDGIYMTWCAYYDDDDGRGFYRISEYDRAEGGWFDWIDHSYGESIVKYWTLLPERP